MTRSIKFLFSLIVLQHIGAVEGAELDPNLPWDSLTDRLSADATLLESTSNQDYVDECYPEFRDKGPDDRSVKNLESQPSGLCLHALSCAFENCKPFEEPTNVTEWLDPSNPLYNVPSAVIFPAVASDVVAVIEFAIENGLELSVKNSGHNQAGASSKKDTLLVNTQRFAEYSPTGIVECSALDESGSISTPRSVNQDMSNQACLMALARKKNAYIRVGGGENYGDVYASVRAFNEAQESFKYHIVGGAVSTVTPMGWTFQGGLGGTTAGRMYGFGTDQVLQIEAVLPTGQHVRFGPTSWEDEEGFFVPKTTAVSGVCNTNPRGEEADWIWESCPQINFDDLWFAFLGGGGGTWGIVTSIYLQLHDYLPLEYIEFPPDVNAAETRCGVPPEDFNKGMEELTWRFFFDYLLDPSSLGVSEADSIACSAPDYPWLFCYGEGMGKKFALTWQAHVLDRKQELLDKNISEESIDKIAKCIPESGVIPYKDTLEQGTPDLEIPRPGLFNWESDEYDDDFFLVLVPLSYYQQEKDTIFELFWSGYIRGAPYMAHGGKATDQATSLSKAHYGAGFMITATPAGRGVLLEAAYGVSSTDTTIPAHIGGNHYVTAMYGPLKSDPTKPCDASSFEEKDEKCFSTQAAVWGENLPRLEAIKKEIDPFGIFNCNKCVGNNLVKDTEDSGGFGAQHNFLVSMLVSVVFFTVL